ncbi:reverse transcriptase domain-containing protein [Tanacetum coccineum]|uniref:Reverse transcriptase domain-containing protein n=1 Tax=Tanacetum coccineum TaxID=301880 RepID=A0ABQ5ANA2_9ASTR
MPRDYAPHGAEIRTSKWCPLSTFVPTTMAPMRRTYSGRLCAPRDSCGFMQYALRTTICSSKSLTVWVLLAHHAPRRARYDTERKCNDCQVHRPIPRQPQQELTPITSPWPFHKWGIDIAGPFPVAAGGLKFLIVAIDYFSKSVRGSDSWSPQYTGNQLKRVVWDKHCVHFGLPGD